MDRDKFVSVVTTVTLIFAAMFASGAFTYVAAYPSPSASGYGEAGIYPGAPTYTIWKESSTCYCKDANGHIPSWGESSNASYLIQSAINNASLRGIIHLAAAEYSIDTTIKVKPEIILEGQGGEAGQKKGTILKLADNADTNIIENENAGTVDRYIIIRDLAINGNNDTNNAGNGIYFTRVERCSIENVDIWNCTENGLVISGTTGTYGAYENNIYNLVVSYCDGDGILLTTDGATQKANENRFFGVFVRNVVNGVNISKGDGNSFFGCEFSQSTNGIWLNDSKNYFAGIRCESNSNKDVIFTSSAERNYVYFNTGSSYTNDGSNNCIQRGQHILHGYFRFYNIAHPSGAGWDSGDAGKTWFCTTHDRLEYWNGTNVINMTGS